MEKLNILVIEDDYTQAKLIGETILSILGQDYDIRLFPDIRNEMSVIQINQLIKNINEFANTGDENHKVTLLTYLKKVMDTQTPDLILLDVSLKDNPLGKDNYGALIRKPILDALFPNAKVIFISEYPTSRFTNFMLENDSRISKKEYGERSFDKVLDIDLRSVLNNLFTLTGNFNNNDRPPMGNKEKQKHLGNQEKINLYKSIENLRFKYETIYPKKASIIIVGFLKITILIATFIFGVTFIVYCFNSFCLIIQHIFGKNNTSSPDQIKKMITELEKLFIAPLPMVILSSFYLYFETIILPKLDASKVLDNPEEELHKTSYLLSLSKILFIAILISITAATIIHNLANEAINSTYKTIYAGVLLIALIIFYWLIEKSMHEVGKAIFKKNYPKR